MRVIRLTFRAADHIAVPNLPLDMTMLGVIIINTGNLAEKAM